MPEAGASTAIVETRASGVARPIVPSVNTCYPTCVSTGAPTAATGDQNNYIGTWSNWYIELYELYPCNSKMELERKEGEIQRQIATINKRVAGRTIKEYCFDNKDKISENKKEYCH